MTHDLSQAAERLAAVLAAENAALADARPAARRRHAGGKAAGGGGIRRRPAGPGAPPAELVHRLRDLAQENRARLEHAIAVQRRIIGIIARAIRSTAPVPALWRDRRDGRRRTMPFTLSARA